MIQTTDYHVKLKHMVKTIIEKELPNNPMTDARIIEYLSLVEGMKNVSPYHIRQKRKELNIPTAMARRKKFLEALEVKK